MVSQNPSPIRVLLAEDHRTLREGLRLLLEVDGDISVVAEVEGGREAVETALTVNPHVILMDVALVGMDGIEATRQLQEKARHINVLMLSAHPEIHLVRATLDAGAVGYVLKRASGKELREGVRAAAAGTSYFSDEVMKVVRERTRPDSSRGERAERPVGDAARADSPSAVLTGREIEILQLIAAGHSNREIAELLGLSIKTIETHRMHVMQKLDIHEIAGLTRYAIRKGLVGA